jgi:hypothetical protein
MLTGLCGIVGFVLGACALHGRRALGLTKLVGVKAMDWARYERATEALFLLCCMGLPMFALEAVFATFSFVTSSASASNPTAAAGVVAFLGSIALRLLGVAATLTVSASAY